MRLAAKILTLFGAFILIVLLVLRFWVLPNFQNSGTTAAALQITKAAIQFQKDHGAIPGGGDRSNNELLAPKAIVSALRGENLSEKNYLQDFPDSVFRDGVIVDSYGRPFRFNLDAEGSLTITSAGANGRFGDTDDITNLSATENGEPSGNPPPKTE